MRSAVANRFAGSASENHSFVWVMRYAIRSAGTKRTTSDMATVTKKDLIDRIADAEGCKRVLVKKVIQRFLNTIIDELGNGNRLEFRDFGVFESKVRAPRQAQNPKTMDKVRVPSRRTVKFKVGRVMKERLEQSQPVIDEATGLAIDAGATQIATPASGDGRPA